MLASRSRPLAAAGPSPGSPRGPRWAVALLVILTLATLAQRLAGVDHHLPQRPDSDSVAVAQAASLRAQVAGEPAAPLEPHYPLLLAGLLAVRPVPEPGPAQDSLEGHLERAAAAYVAARLVVALLSVPAIPLTWLLARRYLDARWALLPAALIATSLLHVELSQEARPHAPLCTFVLLALLGAIRLVERGRPRDHALAGLCAGLAVACLHNGIFALPALAAAQIACWRRDGARALPAVAAAWALVAPIAWVAYFAPLKRTLPPGLTQIDGQLLLSGHFLPLARFDGGGFALLPRLLWDVDPVLLLLAIAGIGVALVQLSRQGWRPRPVTTVVLSYALPYSLVLGLYGQLPARFLLPLVPLLAIAAAVGVQALARLATPGRARGALAAAACLLVLALPTYATTRLTGLRRIPDSPSALARWIEAHVDRELDLLYLSGTVCLPIFQREEGKPRLATADWYLWDGYQSSLPEGVARPEAWRVRRLIAFPSGSRSLAAQDLRALIRAPAADDMGRRFAVIAFSVDLVGIDGAAEAVLAEGGRAVHVEPSVGGDPGDPRSGAMRVLPAAPLVRALFARRLGPTLVVYELPPQGELDPGTPLTPR